MSRSQTIPNDRPVERIVDFEQFVHGTGDRLYRAALLLTGGDHHLAEDLVQTTFEKVLVAWRRVSTVEDPVAYTRTVLTRTFLSHKRLRRSSERPTDVVPDGQAPPHGDDHVSTRLDLMAALRGLDPRDRAVLVLRFWDDRSVAETASVLDITETAVRTRSHRALARLRNRLPDLYLHEQEQDQ